MFTLGKKISPSFGLRISVLLHLQTETFSPLMYYDFKIKTQWKAGILNRKTQPALISVERIKDMRMRYALDSANAYAHKTSLELLHLF